MDALQEQGALADVEAERMRRNKKGPEWPKWKAMLKQLGFCTESRRCGEPVVPGGILCRRHLQIRQDRQARYRANKVKTRGWKWARVPVESAR